ncbi:hypothetical protein GCM10028805_48680 [Spirosoma harenae]
MIALTGYTLPDYLVNRGLLSYADLRDPKWTFIENRFTQSLNSNFIVLYSAENSTRNYFLKQPVSLYFTDDGLQTEEDVLLVLQKINTLQPNILKFIKHPNIYKDGIVRYDSVNRVLLLQYQKSSSILDILKGTIAIPRRNFDKQNAVIAQLGKTLAKFREELPSSIVDRIIVTIFEKRAFSPDFKPFKPFKPWLLDLVDRDVDQLTSSNSPYVEKLGTLLCNTNVKKVLNELNIGWEYSHLINSDASLSNVLVKNEEQEIPEILLIDWEMAGYGPALWQLAGVVADFLSFIVYENPPISEELVWKHLEVIFHNYFSVIPLRSSGGIYGELITTFRYAGIILLQQYYRWGAAYLHSGNSVHPDKFMLGKDCLLTPDIVWKNNKFPSL